MTEPRLILSPIAEEDVIEIGAYIARDNPRRADTFVDEMRDFLSLLSRAPGLGRVRVDLRGQPHSIVFRRFPYVVYYEPLAESAGIRVLRVLHAARDHTRLLGPD